MPAPSLGRSIVGEHRSQRELGETMSTLENRPSTAPRRRRAERRRRGAHERDAVVANVGSLVEKARRERVPVVRVQHCDEQLARGSDDWRIVPELAPATPSRSSRRTTATPSRTPASRPCCQASESGDSSSSAHRPMHASARRCTARSSGGTTRYLSATPTRRKGPDGLGAPPPDQVIAHTNLYSDLPDGAGADGRDDRDQGRRLRQHVLKPVYD